jgi:L-2,4-diaminobutyrate decarboxylase
MLEELCCKALCELFKLSPNSDATFFYSGTYSNQSALYLALHWTAEQKFGFNFAEKGIQGFSNPTRLIIITSQDAHFSLKHALRIMGLGEQSLVTVPVDENRRIDVKLLEKTLNELQETKDVFSIVVTAGTTSTGSIDPILPIAEICNNLGIWLHVDAAYGFAYCLVPELQFLFSGIEQADSITWDPHKQFGVPIPSSLLFVKRKEDFKRMTIYGEYFNREGDPEPNPGLKSPPSTRPFSALPIVTSIRFLGMEKVIERLRKPLKAIKTAYEELKNFKDVELFHKPDLGILCLRMTPEGIPEVQLNHLQQNIYDRIKAEGKRSISLTRLNNKVVLRFVVLNLNVTSDAILETVEYIRSLAKEYQK